MIFPKSGYKILKLIYENPGIRLSKLIKEAGISVETSKKRLGVLLSSNIIREEKIIGGKKTLIKNFYPNLESEEGMSTFSLIESEKKEELFRKNKALIGPFRQLLKNIDKKVKIILVFGSFASYSKTRESDLDILFLARDTKIKNLKKEIEKSFVTFSHEVSPRIDTLNNFRKNKENPIYSTIIKNHIIIKGFREYIKLLN